MKSEQSSTRAETTSERVSPQLEAITEKLCVSLLRAENKTPGLLLLQKHIADHPETIKQVWESFGIGALLLQEISCAYPQFQQHSRSVASESISAVLDILISLCSLKEFRRMYFHAQIPLFLYPMLNSSSKDALVEHVKTQCFVFLRLFLEKNTEDAVQSVEFFKNTELVPLCLRNIELGTKKTKLVALQVFHEIISSREGLEYSCQTYDRFMATSMILNSVLVQMETLQAPEVLEMVILIYTKLCSMPNAKLMFNKNRPGMLYAEHIREMVRRSPRVKIAYEEFLHALQN